MKQMVRKMLITMFSIMVVAILCVVFSIHIYKFKEEYKEQSYILFEQVKHILEKNSLEMESTIEEYKQICLNSADGIAYILSKDIRIIDDIDTLKQLAHFFELDEIHIFNQEGQIVKGTEPKYYGYTVYDGEQIGYFAQMLHNKDLRLCQDFIPNTAEQKEMQYAAVWSLDKTYFIQVGATPQRILELMSKNKLSYIFSLVASNDTSRLYAINSTTGEILGSTNQGVVGNSAKYLGFSMEQITSDDREFSSTILGEKKYCVTDRYNNIILIRTFPMKELYSGVWHDVIVMACCLLCIAIVAIYLMEKFLDNNIVREIYTINQVLKEGDVNQLVEVKSTPEFELLSDCINHMKKTLSDTIEKMSYVLDHASLSMGVYEYNRTTNAVQVTKQVKHILNLSDKKSEQLFGNYEKFEEFLAEVRQNPVKDFNDTYKLQCETGKQYVRMESFKKDGEIMGIIIDVTSSVLRSKRIEQERDIDMLTGIYNRRGFESLLDKIYEDPEITKHSALIMLDADGLKQLNDKYGHKIGDDYLCELVNQVNHISPENTLFSRQGGDEFVLFYYGCNTNEELMKYIGALNKMRDKTEFSVENDTTIKIKYSIGYILCRGRNESYSDLLREADLKMYEDKKERKRAEGQEIR